MLVLQAVIRVSATLLSWTKMQGILFWGTNNNEEIPRCSNTVSQSSDSAASWDSSAMAR